MKQIGSCAAMYTGDNDSYLPAVVNQWGGVHGAGFLVPLYLYFGFKRPASVPDDYRYKEWFAGVGGPLLCPMARILQGYF